MDIENKFKEISFKARNAYITVTMDIFLEKTYPEIYISKEWQYLKNLSWLVIGALDSTAFDETIFMLDQYILYSSSLDEPEQFNRFIDEEIFENIKLQIIEDNRNFFILENKKEKFFNFYNSMNMELRYLFHDFIDMLMCEHAVGEPTGANNLYIMEVLINYMKEKGFSAFPNTQPFNQFSIMERGGWGNPISRKYIEEVIKPGTNPKETEYKHPDIRRN